MCIARLVATRSSLSLATDFEVLAALKDNLVLVAALGALEAEHDLLRGLSLLVEDGLGLTTEARLLPVITALTYNQGEATFRRRLPREKERKKERKTITYPERTQRPCQSCTGLPCGWCAFCTSCRGRRSCGSWER